MSLTHEYPPADITESLKDYLSRRFIDVDNELKKPSRFPERKTMPQKPQIGNVEYFGNPATHNYDAAITAEGLWIFKSTGWTFIA